MLAACADLNSLGKVLAFDCINRSLNTFGIRVRTNKGNYRQLMPKWFKKFDDFGIDYYGTSKKSPFVPNDDDSEGGQLCIYVPLNYVCPVLCINDIDEPHYWQEVLTAHRKVKQLKKSGVNLRTYLSNWARREEPTLQGPELQKVLTNQVSLLDEAIQEFIDLNPWANRVGVSNIMDNGHGGEHQFYVGWKTKDAFADDCGFYYRLQPDNFEHIRKVLNFDRYVGIFYFVFYMPSYLHE